MRRLYNLSVRVAAAIGASALVLLCAPSTFAGPVDLFTVVGDSYADEYYFANSRDQHANWTMQLGEAMPRPLVGSEDLDQDTALGNWWPNTSRGEPRNWGYGLNWARRGHTTDDAINDPNGATESQYEGVKRVLREETPNVDGQEITHAVVALGLNNFNHHNLYGDVYDAPDLVTAQNAADATVNNVVNDIKTIMNGMRSNDPVTGGNPGVEHALFTITDWGRTPDAMNQFTDSSRNQIVTDATEAANAQLIDYAHKHGLLLIDVYSLMNDILDSGTFNFAGHNLDFSTVAGDTDEPQDAFWADDRHPGTIFNGILANTLITGWNQYYDSADMALLTEQQILDAYNNGTLTATGTFNDTFNYEQYVLVPEPASVALFLAGLAMIGIRRRRGRSANV